MGMTEYKNTAERLLKTSSSPISKPLLNNVKNGKVLSPVEIKLEDLDAQKSLLDEFSISIFTGARPFKRCMNYVLDTLLLDEEIGPYLLDTLKDAQKKVEKGVSNQKIHFDFLTSNSRGSKALRKSKTDLRTRRKLESRLNRTVDSHHGRLSFALALNQAKTSKDFRDIILGATSYQKKYLPELLKTHQEIKDKFFAAITKDEADSSSQDIVNSYFHQPEMIAFLTQEQQFRDLLIYEPRLVPKVLTEHNVYYQLIKTNPAFLNFILLYHETLNVKPEMLGSVLDRGDKYVDAYQAQSTKTSESFKDTWFGRLITFLFNLKPAYNDKFIAGVKSSAGQFNEEKLVEEREELIGDEDDSIAEGSPKRTSKKRTDALHFDGRPPAEGSPIKKVLLKDGDTRDETLFVDSDYSFLNMSGEGSLKTKSLMGIDDPSFSDEISAQGSPVKKDGGIQSFSSLSKTFAEGSPIVFTRPIDGPTDFSNGFADASLAFGGSTDRVNSKLASSNERSTIKRRLDFSGLEKREEVKPALDSPSTPRIIQLTMSAEDIQTKSQWLKDHQGTEISLECSILNMSHDSNAVAVEPIDHLNDYLPEQDEKQEQVSLECSIFNMSHDSNAVAVKPIDHLPDCLPEKTDEKSLDCSIFDDMSSVSEGGLEPINALPNYSSDTSGLFDQSDDGFSLFDVTVDEATKGKPLNPLDGLPNYNEEEVVDSVSSLVGGPGGHG